MDFNINDIEPVQLNDAGNELENYGVTSLAILAYECCMYHGLLTLSNYCRLASIYLRKGDTGNYKRVTHRYHQMLGR